MVNAGKTRSRNGTRPLTENTIMKATSWSSMMRSDPITPPLSASSGCSGGRFDRFLSVVVVVVVVSGSERGATARVTPDIFGVFGD